MLEVNNLDHVHVTGPGFEACRHNVEAGYVCP